MTIYYNTNRVVDEGELVVTTNIPSGDFRKACLSVDRKRHILSGVLVTANCDLCAMDITREPDLEVFISGVAQITFYKPAGGIVFRLPNEKSEELRCSYKSASIKRSADKLKFLLDTLGMKLGGGLISSMSFQNVER